MQLIYLDNNATTPMLPAVWEAMRPYAAEQFGNAASAHSFGRVARQALENARETIASLLDAYPEEVVFTSGATEANNLAIFGLAGEPPGRVVASPIEHPSVAEPVAQLSRRGFSVLSLTVDPQGKVVPELTSAVVESAPQLRLIAVMLVNHETGAIQPVDALVGEVEPSVAIHCDAAAAVGKIPVRFHALGVTTMSLCAHKFHGPKGVGVLLVKRGVQLMPMTYGGHQQHGRRPGTEPVALAVGMARALEIACAAREANGAHVQRLREGFLNVLQAAAEPVVLNGPVAVPTETVPHTVNVSFPGCRADALLINLDLAGIACSTGSACSSGSLLPSPVLKAMQVPDAVLHSAMRFSFSHLLSETDVEEAARRISVIVRRLRQGTGDESA